MRSRGTSQRRTMQCICAAGKMPNLNLPAFEFSFANPANSLIVQRVPSPESITGAQNRQPVIKLDMSNHGVRRILRAAQEQTIGAPDDRVIGQNPTRPISTTMEICCARMAPLCEPVDGRARSKSRAQASENLFEMRCDFAQSRCQTVFCAGGSRTRRIGFSFLGGCGRCPCQNLVCGQHPIHRN